MRGDDLAREHKTSRIDFGRAGGIDGAKIVRRDQQPVGAAGPEAGQRNRLSAGAREDGPGGAAKQQGRDASSMSDRHVRLCPHITPAGSNCRCRT